MNFLASIIIAAVSLFMSVLAGYSISKLQTEKDPTERKHTSISVLLFAFLSIILCVAALMIAVNTR